jgi:hypothetical protein
MIDFETYGLQPCVHEISSVAIVCFDMLLGVTKDPGLHMRVDHSIANYGRERDSGTVVWRAENNVEMMERNIKVVCSPKTMCLEIARYMRDIQLRTGKPAMIWAKPTKFDIGFLEAYFHLTGNSDLVPYRHSNTCDLYSWQRGAGVDSRKMHDKAIADMENLHDKAAAHDAMFDCLLQIRNVYHSVTEVFKNHGEALDEFIRITNPQQIDVVGAHEEESE